MRARLLTAVLPTVLLTQTLEHPVGMTGQEVLAGNRVAPRPSITGGRPHYVAVAFHDVVDQRGSSANDETVTASNLVSFLEWLHANNWTAITLDDIARARAGTRPLAAHAVLLTFDDGYRSLYTRVYPLLLAYKIPEVSGHVGSWMEWPNLGTTRRGNDLVPGTDDLVFWDQAREMAKSGLVEFASHSYDLHHSHTANPQRGEQPAGITLQYDITKGYETEDEYRQRIRSDLERSRALMQRELGRAPRAVVWPYGRYTRAAREEALAARYEFLLTMDPEPGFPEDLPQVPRLLPVRDPNLPTMVSSIVPDPPGAVRLVGLNPAALVSENAAIFEKNLSAAIERVRALGATTVVVDAAVSGPQGRLEAVWFPNRVLPMKADVLARVVWQVRTRARVEVAVTLPVSAARTALGDDAAVLRLFEDLAYHEAGDALLLENAPTLAAIPLENSAGLFRWAVRRRRNGLNLSRLPAGDALALMAFFEIERVRPANRLFLLAPSVGEAPSGVADLTLVEAPVELGPFRQVVERLTTAGWLNPDRRYNTGVWIRSEKPPSAEALSANVRLFQRRGGVAFGWEQDDPAGDEPKARLAAPSVSAARFPLKF